MNDLVHVLLGAILVAIGVLATALADRIRGIRHEAASRVAKPHTAFKPQPKANRHVLKERTGGDGGEDVVAALVAAGYTKSLATEAARGCSVVERTTIEEWTRAALRHCARGATS